MTQKALRFALEALDNLMYWDNGKSEYDEARDAIIAIKEALAQPEQEPVAWVCMKGEKHDIDFDQPEIDAIPVGTFLYTTPPQRTWVGLTDEEIDVIDEATWDEDHKSWGIHDFARAIEAKLKEKNT